MMLAKLPIGDIPHAEAVDSPDHANGKRAAPLDAARRRAKARGCEQLLTSLADAYGGEADATALARHLARVAAEGQPTEARRTDAIRGAADLLEELTRQLRQMTAGASRT